MKNMEEQGVSSGQVFQNLSIQPEQLPAIATVEWRPLSGAYLQALVLRMWLFRLSVLAVFAVAALLSPAIPLTLILWVSAGWLILALATMAYLKYRHRAMGYAVREHDLLYRSGLLYRRTVAIPFNRMQHSEVLQGVIDRQFGLARLAVFTAGGSSSDLVIPGLEAEQAYRMREFLGEKVADE